MFRSILLAAVAAAFLSACGGSRPPQPIAVTAPTDASMTCQQINDEITNNEFQIVARQNEMNQAAQERSRNTFMGGFIGYSTSEDGSAAMQESTSFAARNVQLRSLAREKKCTY